MSFRVGLLVLRPIANNRVFSFSTFLQRKLAILLNTPTFHKLSLVIQQEGTKLPEIFDLIIRVFVSTTISTSERSERVEIV
jgi:hypothetical protein